MTMTDRELVAEMRVASETIRRKLSPGVEMVPGDLVERVKIEHPELSRDAIRGAVWQIINEREVETTPRGTIRLLTEAQRKALLHHLAELRRS